VCLCAVFRHPVPAAGRLDAFDEREEQLQDHWGPSPGACSAEGLLQGAGGCSTAGAGPAFESAGAGGAGGLLEHGCRRGDAVGRRPACCRSTRRGEYPGRRGRRKARPSRCPPRRVVTVRTGPCRGSGRGNRCDCRRARRRCGPCTAGPRGPSSSYRGGRLSRARRWSGTGARCALKQTSVSGVPAGPEGAGRGTHREDVAADARLASARAGERASPRYGCGRARGGPRSSGRRARHVFGDARGVHPDGCDLGPHRVGQETVSGCVPGRGMSHARPTAFSHPEPETIERVSRMDADHASAMSEYLPSMICRSSSATSSRVALTQPTTQSCIRPFTAPMRAAAVMR